MIFVVTIFILCGTFLIAALLLGRVTLMVLGAALLMAAVVSYTQSYLPDLHSGAVAGFGILFGLAGRPSWLRPGHKRRTTRTAEA